MKLRSKSYEIVLCETKLNLNFVSFVKKWFFLTAVLQTGAVSSASGSAYAEFGNTKVIVSV